MILVSTVGWRLLAQSDNAYGHSRMMLVGRMIAVGTVGWCVWDSRMMRLSTVGTMPVGTVGWCLWAQADDACEHSQMMPLATVGWCLWAQSQPLGAPRRTVIPAIRETIFARHVFGLHLLLARSKAKICQTQAKNKIKSCMCHSSVQLPCWLKPNFWYGRLSTTTFV